MKQVVDSFSDPVYADKMPAERFSFSISYLKTLAFIAFALNVTDRIINRVIYNVTSTFSSLVHFTWTCSFAAIAESKVELLLVAILFVKLRDII